MKLNISSSSLRQLFQLAKLAVVLLIAACASQTEHKDSKFGINVKKTPRNDGVYKTEGGSPDPLNLNRKTYLLLQVDGGGIMGITPAIVVNEIEKQLRLRPGCSDSTLRDHFSVCVGTSTGSIIAGMVTAGVHGSVIEDYYCRDGVKLFNGEGRNRFPIYPIFKYKFKRDKFQQKLFDVLAEHSFCKCSTQTLNDLYEGPLLVIPAYDLVSKRTQFFRTRDINDGRLKSNGNVLLVDAISASAFSAALYFGKLPAPEFEWNYWQADGYNDWQQGAVFNDGGQGTQNSATAQTALESIVRNWGNSIGTDDQVVIISLGCGNDFAPRSYEKLRRINGAGQLGDFIFRNQARSESTLIQWIGLKRIAKTNPNFKVFRFDWVNDPKIVGETSAFSINDKQKNLYRAKAEEIIQRPDFTRLMDDLRKVTQIVKPGPKR